jgi:hypothetical protein
MSDFKVPDYWTPEQAIAVFELIDEIRDEILALYQLCIVEQMKEDRCYDLEGYEEFEDKDIPF